MIAGASKTFYSLRRTFIFVFDFFFYAVWYSDSRGVRDIHGRSIVAEFADSCTVTSLLQTMRSRVSAKKKMLQLSRLVVFV